MQSSTPFAAFVRGATRPSLPALVGVLVAAAGLALVATRVLRPERVARFDARVLMNHAHDDFARLTVEALRLRHEPPPRLDVLVVGASETREAISSVDDLQEALARRTGRRPVARVLTAGDLAPWEAFAVLECLAEPPRVVVLTVGPSQLARGLGEWQEQLDEPRLGFDAPWVAGEAERAGLAVPARTGVYVRDHFRFFAARRSVLWRLFTGPVETRRHRFVGREPLTELEPERVAARVAERLDGYEANREASLDLLARAIERLRTRGSAEVVLLEAPRNPDLEGALVPRGLLDDHAARLAAFAREHGVQYATLQDEADLRGSDFYDHCHLRDPAAAERFTAALAARLAALLST